MAASAQIPYARTPHNDLSLSLAQRGPKSKSPRALLFASHRSWDADFDAAMAAYSKVEMAMSPGPECATHSCQEATCFMDSSDSSHTNSPFESFAHLSGAQFCTVLRSLGSEWHWGVDVLLVWPSLWSPGCSRPRVAQWCTVTVHRVHRELRGGHIGRCRLNGWGRVIATRRCRRRLWRARYFGCMTWVYISNIEYTLSTTFWAIGVTDGTYRRWNWSRASCEFWPKSMSTWVWVCTLASEAWNSIDETHVPSDGHGACKEDDQWGVITLGHFDTWCWFLVFFSEDLTREPAHLWKAATLDVLETPLAVATGSCRYGHSKISKWNWKVMKLGSHQMISPFWNRFHVRFESCGASLRCQISDTGTYALLYSVKVLANFRSPRLMQSSFVFVHFVQFLWCWHI